MSGSTVSPTEYVPRHRFPSTDTDLHFKRVIKYIRPSDLATWLGFTAAFPALLYAWDLSDRIPVRHVRTQPRFYALGTWLGFSGGFLMAYIRGCSKPIWGESTLQPWIQTVAHHNSQFAHLKFSTIPWFNFVNHPYHGVDVSKYYQDAKIWRQENGLEN
ncbi:hypothetical protein Pst134EA_025817 [Puccinia striiformis f. sp. tritici]|uniref:hypothetical protein n=1 Tax=Puccinia striiformis f. sp. tritici TaxID=168172 RepID=UPI002008BCBC|nr:hypothetical protein Pst134EA_025817 [Puccinia striiformis f. sp. tritici]KAH9451876.1 hypothetical protein Pst134EA_025817 [Puccinia striiformis f. sp. tritici]